MPEFVRVRDKSTRHEYTIRRDQLNPKGHEELNKPAATRGGVPLPPKHYVKPKPATPKSPASDPEPEVDGQKAGSEKENR